MTRTAAARDKLQLVSGSKQHLLDVSDLPPPEPLECVLDALADLPAGDSLKVMLPLEPVMLYPMLRSMGMRWERSETQDASVELLIWEDPAR